MRDSKNPRSNTVCVYVGDDENSSQIFNKKLASTKNPRPIELHKKLTSRNNDAEPNFKTEILPNCNPKNGLLRRWIELKAVFVKAANDKFTRMAIEAVKIVDIWVFLKLCTTNIFFLSSPCIWQRKLSSSTQKID